ncbi:hypothetical protein Tcan_00305 [Toxocara canis]|uniref:Uncharacterized protein n=1 Tax=Toxocara canis TaxID=6265 RepID=A0A0B2UR02_TOXCA|nr:hypothetical protein Tcan_00305 [Toxocara canis]
MKWFTVMAKIPCQLRIGTPRQLDKCAENSPKWANQNACACSVLQTKLDNMRGKIASEDGHFCIDCIGSNNSSASDLSGRCGRCPGGEISVASISPQNTLTKRICKRCPNGTMVSSDYLYCIPCSTLYNNTCACTVS